jgi:hypothetical protein
VIEVTVVSNRKKLIVAVVGVIVGALGAAGGVLANSEPMHTTPPTVISQDQADHIPPGSTSYPVP